MCHVISIWLHEQSIYAILYLVTLICNYWGELAPYWGVFVLDNRKFQSYVFTGLACDLESSLTETAGTAPFPALFAIVRTFSYHAIAGACYLENVARTTACCCWKWQSVRGYCFFSERAAAGRWRDLGHIGLAGEEAFIKHFLAFWW